MLATPGTLVHQLIYCIVAPATADAEDAANQMPVLASEAEVFGVTEISQLAATFLCMMLEMYGELTCISCPQRGMLDACNGLFQVACTSSELLCVDDDTTFELQMHESGS